MELALKLVERHCLPELNAYVECVDANPRGWGAACDERKRALSACAAKQCVPSRQPSRRRSHARRPPGGSSVVNSVKDRCRPQIEQYERCLKGNPESAQTCAVQLERLWQCSDGLESAAAAGAAATHPPNCTCGQHQPPGG